MGEEAIGNGNAFVLRVADIKPDGIINYKAAPLRKVKKEDLEKYKLQRGDIVVVKSSGNQTKIISGRAAIFDYTGKETYLPSNYLITLRPNHNLILPMWLWVSLNRKEARRFIRKIVGPTTYPNLRSEKYLKMEIPLSPLPIQQKSVERLDAIRKAQELNDKQIALAEEFFQSLLHRELDPKGKNWKIKKLGEICDFEGGSQPPKSKFIEQPKEGYVRLLQIRDFESDEKAVYVPYSKKLRFCDKEDVLIARYGASLGKILWGKAVLTM